MSLMKNKKWFLLMEVLISISMFAIFSSGYVFFLMQQNLKNQQDEYGVTSDNLIREMEEYLKNYKTTSPLPSGTYSLSYDSSISSYTLSPSGNQFVDEKGEAISENDVGSFKRNAIINTGTLPFSGSIVIPYASLTVHIWPPGCLRSGNSCISRKSMLY